MVYSKLFTQDIKFLAGVGPKKAEVLKGELGITSFGDMLYYFPYKYVDRTKFYSCNEIKSNMSHVQIKGKITSLELVGEGRKQRLTAMFTDGTGVIELIWFSGVKYVKSQLKNGGEFIVFGKPSAFNGRYNIVHPEMETLADHQSNISGSIQAFYITSEKMKRNYLSSKAILKIQSNLQSSLKDIYETFPVWFVEKLKLMPLKEALKNIHFPENNEQLKRAQFRLKFEELLYIQIKLLSLRSNRLEKFKGHIFQTIGDVFNRFFHECIPFELTNAQKKVLREIRKDVGSGHQMNRLLQGDVGSGKTLVALMTMLMAIDNNTQACLMAPTEILANQHYKTITQLLKPLGLNVGLLTGSTKQKARKELHAALEDGSMEVLIGTHALIENKVKFKNLGMVVVDEQHRFGVAQRAKLWNKNKIPPHVLVMTATPIPRTLAMTLYGDLDVSVIDELPPGRKPVRTIHYFDNKRKLVYDFIRKELQGGRQAYIVYPLIEESEKLDYKNLQDGFETVKKVFPEFEIAMVHGKMKPAEKDEEMLRFKNKGAHILVSTTVIEVGVDVPNASIMVIESSERFGLSQLHQLRGRVGRGADQSYCVLMSSYKLSKETQIRLDTMVRTTDGFEIAETDLKLRGPGDIDGTQQSGVGFDLKISNLGRDGEILQYARNIAQEIMKEDPLLGDDKNRIFSRELKKMKQTSFNWSVIS